MNFVYVAFGAAIGAVLRYAISLIPCNMDFPILTLAVNLIGALLIGFITGIAMLYAVLSVRLGNNTVKAY